MRWDSDPETVCLYAVSRRGLVEGALLPQGLAIALEMHKLDGLVIERYEDETREVIVFRARKPREPGEALAVRQRRIGEAGELLLKPQSWGPKPSKQ